MPFASAILALALSTSAAAFDPASLAKDMQPRDDVSTHRIGSREPDLAVWLRGRIVRSLKRRLKGCST